MTVYKASFKKDSLRFAPTIVVIVCVVLPVLYIVYRIGLPFSYPLDDTYIHLDIARSIADHGVWGIDPEAAASASSSPLFTLLLSALCFVIRPDDLRLYIPIVVNALAAIALVILWLRILKRSSLLLLEVLLLAFAVPLPVLLVLSMEHVLQILVTTAFLYAFSRQAAGDAALPAWVALLLTALCATIRYEGAALIVCMAVAAVSARQWKAFGLLVIGTVLPLTAFGLYWHAHGGWFVPNPVVLKPLEQPQPGLMGAIRHNLTDLVVGGAYARRTVKALIAMLAIAFVGPVMQMFRTRKVTWQQWFAASALAATVIQLLIGKLAWLYRYEAWLVALDVLSLILLADATRRLTIKTAVLGLIFAVVFDRSLDASKMVYSAAQDRKIEHILPARMIENDYNGRAILANDVGALAWFGNRSHVIDTYGLGNNQIAQMRLKAGGMRPSDLFAVQGYRDAPIAIVQLCWPPVASIIPDEWTLVAIWRIPRNVVFGDRFVGFFATSGTEEAPLEANLRKLPIPAGLRVFYRSSPGSFLTTISDDDLRHGACDALEREVTR